MHPNPIYTSTANGAHEWGDLEDSLGEGIPKGHPKRTTEWPQKACLSPLVQTFLKSLFIQMSRLSILEEHP